jgi:hypothetical protein
MIFVDIDPMSLPNLTDLDKLIRCGKEYTYYREIDVGENFYLFAFDHNPFTIEEALIEWRRIDS